MHSSYLCLLNLLTARKNGSISLNIWKYY